MGMNNLNRFRKVYGLKSVYRSCLVGDGKESSSEHSWSCLMLADFLLDLVPGKIDRLKVYELLMYHDLVEVEVGDVVLHPEKVIDKKLKKKMESSSALKLGNELPSLIGSKYLKLYSEYEERETIEAKFAKAVDALDPMIHQLDNKGDWDGWTREFLIENKLRYFENFPELRKMFFEILDYLESEGYI